MQPRDLIEAARVLCRIEAEAPPEVCLRRAVSTAYYGLFHCLCRAAADTLVDGADEVDGTWLRVYRALNHGSARRACTNAAFLARLPAELRLFAQTFATLQEKRHTADYAPNVPFKQSQVAEDIEMADLAIVNFDAAPPRERRAFAAAVLFERRV